VRVSGKGGSGGLGFGVGGVVCWVLGLVVRISIGWAGLESLWHRGRNVGWFWCAFVGGVGGAM